VSTAGSTHLASDEHLAVSTGGHVGLAVGKSVYASVANAFALFVHKLGIKLIAASGKVHIEAQRDRMELIAERVLKLMSTKDWIEILAKQGIRLNGGGSEVEITPDGVFVYTKGQHLVHAANHQGLGPQARPLVLPELPTGELTSEWVAFVDHTTGQPVADFPYRLDAGEGHVIEGVSDSRGHSAQVRTPTSKPVIVTTPAAQDEPDQYHVRHLNVLGESV
ncbi:DUF2345 domain-containing protein, partial [Ralstonia sp. UBA689]|uniref:DUF2345 domain-containing protein n=1 Tax=Ralstonia sp. UBA689 TaxID=1947373 RepID=UPI0025CCD8D8